MTKNFLTLLSLLGFCVVSMPLCSATLDEAAASEQRGSKRKLSETTDSSQKKYAIATTDTAFKHLLSPEEGNFDVLRSFLQTFVPSFHDDPITTIQPMPVAIPPLRERGERQTFMDLHVKTAKTHYIIEMQAKRHVMFDERALFYACSTYSKQLPQERLVKGVPWYCELKPVIAIQVLDYDSSRVMESTAAGVSDSLVRRAEGHPMAEGQFFKHYLLTDRESGQVIDHLQLIQVEIPRGRELLKGKPDHKTFTSIDWWLELFCFSEDYSADRVTDLKQEGVEVPAFFEHALQRLDRTVWSPQMQKEYDVDLTDRAAYATVLAVERSEGKKEGISEGRKEGLLVGAREMKKLKTMTNAEIAEKLKLTEAEVSEVKDDDLAE